MGTDHFVERTRQWCEFWGKNSAIVLFLNPMYSRQEASQLKKEFWTAFGQYMAPVSSAEGGRINWMNYKTGEKHIYFRMHADTRSAVIAIELTHPDPEIQQIVYEHFEQQKRLLHDTLHEEWTWVLHTKDENGKTISKIYKDLSSVNVFNKEHWPVLISFFKPRIIALDEFWSMVKYSFETLR